MRIIKYKISIIQVISVFLFLLLNFIIGFGADNAKISSFYSIDSYGIHKRNLVDESDTIIFNTTGMYGVSYSVSPADSIIALLFQ